MLAVLVALAVLGAGCSSSGSDGTTAKGAKGAKADAGAARSGRGAATTTTRFDPPGRAPEPSTSTPAGAFYEVPDPLPAGPPGEIIRMEVVDDDDPAATTMRVMYHSRDALDHDRAVTGLITYPSAEAPRDGWPVVAWAHGTTGLAPKCAPSHFTSSAPAFGIEGVRVATDYIGLGPIGERHAYLDGPAEGHSVIDIVRAARTIPEAHASARWVGIGHSQGGHAALWSHQLGAAYAPELDLLGTVAIAPAAMLTETYGPSDQVVPRMVGVMMLYGGAHDHPEIDPHDYVGPAVRKAEGVIDTGCLNDVVDAMVAIPADTFYAHDPLETEPARSLARANDTGTAAVEAPLLEVYGTDDAEVVPDRAHALFDRLCEVGQATEVVRADGGTHDSVVGKAGKEITAWLQARIGGERATDDCPDGWR